MYRLLRGVTFEVLPFTSYALRPTIVGNIFEAPFMEQLSVQSHIF